MGDCCSPQPRSLLIHDLTEKSCCNIGCLPKTSGMPNYVPGDEEVPLAYDESSNTVWFYVCDAGWFEFSDSLCRLESAEEVLALNTLCEILRIPVVYEFGGECREGTLKASEIAQVIADCLGLEDICSAEKINSTQVNNLLTQEGSDGIVWTAVCINGEKYLVQAPSGSGDAGCIDFVQGKPVNPPGEDEVPVKIDCDGGVWFYTCENGWYKPSPGVPDLSELDPLDVDNLCEDLKFQVWYESGDCVTQREVKLQVLTELISQCICAAEIDSSTETEVALVCDGDGSIVQRPIKKSCNCYVAESLSTGGGVCFQVNSSPSVNSPVIFRGRDLSFIRGAGTTVDAFGVGLISDVIKNPSADQNCVARVSMTGMANRSLGVPDVALSFVFMVSETLNEPIPTDDPSAVAIRTFAPKNVSFVKLDTANNYDLASTGEFINSNYSAESPATMVWETQLSPSEDRTIYGQWWAVLAAEAGTAGGSGVIYGHGTMNISVEYYIGGVLVSTEQL